jgi:hypothetical protein
MSGIKDANLYMTYSDVDIRHHEDRRYLIFTAALMSELVKNLERVECIHKRHLPINMSTRYP